MRENGRKARAEKIIAVNDTSTNQALLQRSDKHNTTWQRSIRHLVHFLSVHFAIMLHGVNCTFQFLDDSEFYRIYFVHQIQTFHIQKISQEPMN